MSNKNSRTPAEAHCSFGVLCFKRPQLYPKRIIAMNFFTPPPVIKAELFLRIPDSMRCIGQDSEWRGGFTRPFQDIFLEGPVADSAGNLFVVDVPYGRILQIGSNKEVKVCAKWDGEPNGLAATTGGQLLVADYKQVHLVTSKFIWKMNEE